MKATSSNGNLRADYEGNEFLRSGSVSVRRREEDEFGALTHIRTTEFTRQDSLGECRCMSSEFGIEGILSVVRTLRAYDARTYFTVSLSVANTSRSRTLNLWGIRILDGVLSLSAEAAKVLTNAWERCGDTGYLEQLDKAGKLSSAWSVCAFDRQYPLAVAIGVLSGRQMFTYFTLNAGRSGNIHLSAVADTRSGRKGVAIPAGENWEADTIIVVPDPSPYKALETYARAVQAHNGIELPEQPAVGWCDWYHYYGNNSQETILANLAAIDEKLKGYGVHFIQIDDGWQRIKEFAHYAPLNLTYSNSSGAPWDENEGFRMGMKALAAEIHRRGYKAGLWIRPFCVMNAAEEYKRGEPWVLPYGVDDPMPTRASVDISNPDAQAWLKGLFEKITHDWAYDYVKYDFVTYDVLTRQTFDQAKDDVGTFRVNNPRITSAHAYHEALRAFREGAGGGAFLLACNCLAGSAIGVVDGLRISGDVCLTSWDLTKKMLRTNAYRYYQNGFFWQNDPDVVQVSAKLPRHEGVFWASLVSLCGGMILLGDAIAELPDDRIDILKKILPPHGGRARPLRLFEEDWPCVWHLAIERTFGRWDIVGLFNWGSDEAEIAFDFSELGLDNNRAFHVFDFWAEEYLGIFPNRCSLRVKGDSCRVLSLRESQAAPQVIGTHYHIAQGAREISAETWTADTNTLRIETFGVPGSRLELYVKIPPAFYLDALTCETPCRCSVFTEGVLKLELTVDCKARDIIDVRFSRKGL